MVTSPDKSRFKKVSVLEPASVDGSSETAPPIGKVVSDWSNVDAGKASEALCVKARGIYHAVKITMGLVKAPVFAEDPLQ